MQYVHVGRTALRSVGSKVLIMFHFDWTQVQNSAQISVQMIYVFRLFFFFPSFGPRALVVPQLLISGTANFVYNYIRVPRQKV